MAGYFYLIFISSFFTEYYNFWKLIGVPAQHLLFGDLRIVLSGFECTKLGYDVLLENPCNPFEQPNHGAIFYPRIWMALAPLGLEQSQTIFLGLVFTLLFYIVAIIMIGRLNYYEATVYALIFCSPPLMLLVERDNPDIILFLLLAISLTIVSKSSRLVYRVIAYATILFTAILKLYPIFGLIVVFREKRKVCILLLASLITPFLIYSFSHLEELKTIAREAPNTAWYSYGYKVIFDELINYFSSPYIVASKKAILNLVFGVAVGLVSCILGCKLAVKVFQEFNAWLIHKFQLKNKLGQLDNERLNNFRLGSSLYVGTFLIGSIYDYKLVFLLFVIPQILADINSKNKLGLPSSIALIGIIATLYLSPFSRFSLGEIISWFLLGDFLYSLSITLPDWIKFRIYSSSSKLGAK